MTKLSIESQEILKDQIEFSLKKIQENLTVFDKLVPPAASKNQVYIPEENIDWTASFWLGMLFLAKEIDRTAQYDAVIENQLNSFKNRLQNQICLETHDIGFLYTLSAVADYRLTGNTDSRAMAIEAADLLMKRYNKNANIIQAWGDLNDPEQKGRIIIDCLMNLPLLYFVSEETGNKAYSDAAYKHAKQTQKYIVRDNFTTYHTFFFDTETGEAKYGKTAQGYSDDSCWARGQAWGIYGFALSYTYTGDVSFLETAKHLADYFLAHLPSDKIPFWDLIFTDGDNQERDSSSGAIAACGLLELAKHLPLTDTAREKYESSAVELIEALAKNVTTEKTPESNGLLLHGVYNKNTNQGVDECTSWGDYFYLEALTRLNQPWNKYW